MTQRYSRPAQLAVRGGNAESRLHFPTTASSTAAVYLYYFMCNGYYGFGMLFLQWGLQATLWLDSEDQCRWWRGAKAGKYVRY